MQEEATADSQNGVTIQTETSPREQSMREARWGGRQTNHGFSASEHKDSKDFRARRTDLGRRKRGRGGSDSIAGLSNTQVRARPKLWST